MNNNIAYLRKKAGLSQEELSKRINISRVNLSNIETGHQKTFRVDTAARISRELNCTIDDLLKEDA